MAQSKGALKQWGEKWRHHAKEHSVFEMKDMLDLQLTGVGKAVLCVANGYSFEENLETIKKYADNVDIFCCDKTLKPLIENGIKPKYCLVCDASVDFAKYMQPVENQLQDTILIQNVCANPEWAKSGNWKDKYFFVNKDCLGSEKEFIEISGCPNVIIAGTNVSNAMVVMLTQCETSKNNFFGYDKILMIGFDYCWDDNAYYSFDKDGGGKTNYMRQCTVFNQMGDLVYTSANLLFSAKWLERYVKASRISAIQCSKRSIVPGVKVCDLAEQMQYQFRPQDSQELVNLIEYRRKREAEIRNINQRITEIGRDHYKSFIRTI